MKNHIKIFLLATSDIDKTNGYIESNNGSKYLTLK